METSDIKLIDFKNGNKQWFLNGEGVYLPAFKKSLNDFLLQYGALLTDEQIQPIVDQLNKDINTIILPTIQSSIPKIAATQNQIINILKPDYASVAPWLFYTWEDIPEEYIATVLQAHYNNDIDISLFWQVGQTREYQNGNKKVCYTIVDFNKDLLTTPINGHTTSAITLFVTTNNVISPPANWYYNDDSAYGFTDEVNTDVEQFLNYLTDNEINDTYFNTASHLLSVSKDVYYISSSTSSGDAYKKFTLNQQIHIPSYNELFAKCVRDAIYNQLLTNNYQSPNYGITIYLRTYYNESLVYKLFQDAAGSEYKDTTYSNIFTLVPYFVKQSSSSSSNYNTNCTLRDTNSTGSQAYYEYDSTPRLIFSRDSYWGTQNGLLNANRERSDFGVLIINI